MTGTLSGYLIYRLQDKIKERTGLLIYYDDLICALTQSLIELDNDMKENDTIDLPSGRYLTASKPIT